MTSAAFLTQPVTRWVDARRVLVDDLTVDMGVRLSGLELWAEDRRLTDRVCLSTLATTTVIRIPAGFDYDGASIPWWAIPILGPKEEYECAGAIHDALYRWQAPRDLADEAFWIIARSGSKRVTPFRGWLGWAGLRLGGWIAYRRYRS